MFLLNGTLEYYIGLYEMAGITILVNDGKVIGFQEEIPTQTANPSGDK